MGWSRQPNINVPGWLEVRENITLEDPNSQVRFKLKHQATWMISKPNYIGEPSEVVITNTDGCTPIQKTKTKHGI